MTTRRSIVLGLAAMPLFGGLAALSGCDSDGGGDVPKTPEERKEKAQPSTDYMREQYSKKKKK